jgi:hypothetical protein
MSFRSSIGATRNPGIWMNIKQKDVNRPDICQYVQVCGLFRSRSDLGGRMVRFARAR